MRKNRNSPVEGQVYRCTWKKRGAVFQLQCEKPRVESAHADLELAQENLHAKIMDDTGDGEAHLQFDPALPESRTIQSRFAPEYYYVGYNDAVEWIEDNLHELFSNGVCVRCGRGLGLRTAIPRKVTSMPRFDIVGFRKDLNVRVMFSDLFLKHFRSLLPKEGRLIEVNFDLAIQKKLAGKKYYELDFAPLVEVAIPREHDGFNKYSSLRCPKCKSQQFSFTATRIRKQPSTFALRSCAQGEVLLLGEGFFRVVAISAQLRERILKDKKVKGFVTDRLVMLDDNEVLSAEELQKVKLPSP